MKKTFIFMLLALITGISAQKYVPFPTENAQWNILYASAIHQLKIDTTLLKYGLQGDTTINGISYHKLCKITGTNVSPKYVFTGGLREQDKKIYFYGSGYSTSNLSSSWKREYLLYDFNKKTGDSVVFDHERWYKIINIDSVKIGSDFRKRYEIITRYSITSEFILEGIGDVNQGLLGMITDITTCEECYVNWEFVCFSQNGESVYKKPDYVDCNSTRKWKDIPYVPFPTSNASWSEIQAQQGACEPAGFCRHQYKMLGDTTINSVMYHKIYRQDDSLATSITAVYFGALREESKKIYFRSENCNHEIRLYDFSKNVGDTLTNFYSEMTPCNPTYLGSGTITAIDSILIDGSYRRVFHLDVLQNGNVWIEGIGSTNGLFNTVIPALNCICSWYLICYHQNNQVKFLNNDSQLSSVAPHITCFPTTIDGIDQVASKHSVSVTPNPLMAISTLKWSGDDRFSTLTITDLLGKTVQTLDVRGKSEISLNRSDFNKGLYIGRLVADKGSEAIIKIIVQ